MKLICLTSLGMFLDSYFGSRVETIKVIQFTFDKESLIPIDEICTVNTTGLLDVVGYIRWLWAKTLIQTSVGNSLYVSDGYCTIKQDT